MKVQTRLIFFLLMIFLSRPVWADLAGDLLQASDKGRGGIVEGLGWSAQIETHEEGEDSSRGFLIKARDHDAFVEATSPARNKGEVFIFNDRVMWFYKPGLKKPVGISSRQKLTGQAANGDIASTHYARDYTPTLEKTEVLNGQKAYVLLLKAKADNMTYEQIRYWILDSTKLAVKAEFLTIQGKVFKIGEMTYRNVLKWHSKNLPFISELRITDAKFPQNYSVIKYASPHTDNFDESIFNVNRLSR